jgi:3-dehydroquinate synthetase
MNQDKKARDGRPIFILARGIGKSFIAADVPLEPVAQLLDDAIHQAANGD